MLELADKQFEIIGADMSFSQIPENEEITVGKKKVKWYDYYRFTKEQEKEWREWYQEKLKNIPYPVSIFILEMVYGFRLEIEKGS